MATAKTIIGAVGILTLLLLAVDVHSHDHGYISFSYDVGAKGPDKWSSLCPEYAACSKGKMQSPIDIARESISWNKGLQILNRDYKPANATLINYGFSVGIKMETEAGVLVIGNKNYSLREATWHTPAEHTIDGVRHDAELHLVHEADDGAISVVAILYKVGDPDPFVCQVENGLMQLAKETCKADEEAHIPLGNIRTKQLKRFTSKYFRYMGSLTAPPCTEKVLWNILGKVREISKEQLDALKAPLGADYKNNSRPLQASNGRVVELYENTSQKEA